MANVKPINATIEERIKIMPQWKRALYLIGGLIGIAVGVCLLGLIIGALWSLAVKAFHLTSF